MASKKDDFPNLRDGEWEQTSAVDPKYNCIAFAAGRVDVYWWPDEYPDPDAIYWPKDITRAETVEAIAELFIKLYGYRDNCADGSLETGHEKVAIYALGDKPTHAAKQLTDGRWLSKLGAQDDIEHNTLDALAGLCYGKPVKFLKRPIGLPMTPKPPTPTDIIT
jgi:hypothetical protein